MLYFHIFFAVILGKGLPHLCSLIIFSELSQPSGCGAFRGKGSRVPTEDSPLGMI